MSIKEVHVPDIGTDEAVEIIEIAIAPGDPIKVDDSLLTLESEKASMDLPSPFSGTVKELKVKVGDKVSQGDLILIMKTEESGNETAEKVVAEAPVKQPLEPVKPVIQPQATKPQEKPVEIASVPSDVNASPSVRRFARALGVDLTKVVGTGRKNRIEPSDVEKHVKAVMQGLKSAGGVGLDVLPMAEIDFSKFGEIDVVPLSRIKKISGKNLHRNWVIAPHVTQFDEADITDLEAFRNESKSEAIDKGFKLTLIVFIMKAVVKALHAFPEFNASLDSAVEQLVLKKYFHIGVAVDTPNGLMVPVIRHCECKGILDLAKELGEVSERAREGKIKPTEMQGGCFTISSLGGIGGTAFTPIINLPEVAILGVSKSTIKPVYHQGEFKPRLMLPLSLSYDHRVIDGALGARFITFLSSCLSDIKKLTL